MPKNKGLTKADATKAHSLFIRALRLQGDIYNFKIRMEAVYKKDLGEKLRDAAFEMHIIWNKLEEVRNEIFEQVYDV